MSHAVHIMFLEPIQYIVGVRECRKIFHSVHLHFKEAHTSAFNQDSSKLTDFNKFVNKFFCVVFRSCNVNTINKFWHNGNPVSILMKIEMLRNLLTLQKAHVKYTLVQPIFRSCIGVNESIGGCLRGATCASFSSDPLLVVSMLHFFSLSWFESM